MRALRLKALSLTTAALLILGVAASAETLEDTINETFAFAPGSLLKLSNTNGDVEITTWDRDEIQIEARKKVRASSDDRAREAFDDLEIHIEESAGGITIETEYPRNRGSWWNNVSSSVHYSVRVPARSDLAIDTVNGKIRIRTVHGRLDLSTTNGGIDVEEAGGSVTARTTNGGIDVELSQVEASENMSFRTTNGSVTLTIPADVQADLSARTTNGSVRTDFPITVQGSFRKNRLEGELNGGGASIEMKTTNGSIHIREL